MDKKKVLFVCVHNSARSQMAEALLKALAGDGFEVMSAGLEPRTINPFVVEVMKEGVSTSRVTRPRASSTLTRKENCFPMS